MAKTKKSKLTIEDALVPVEEQPYKIPENWCWSTIEAIYGINPKNQADDSVPASFIPMEKIEGGFTSDFTYEIQEWGKAKKAHTQFADGDVAFAKISPCFENRKSMIVTGLENGIGAGTTELIILRQSRMNQKYTYYFVSNEEFINGGRATYSGTVGQQRISMDYVRNYPVPIPPLEEQKRIVEQIENLFSKLDEAKEKAGIVIDSFDERRVAILHKAFEGMLTQKWRVDNNVDLATWKTIPLKDCGRWFGGGTPTTSVDAYWENGDIPWITSKDMKDRIIEDSLMHITMTGVENSSANYCDEPAVLFVMRSGILRRVFPVCMVKRPFTVNQDLKACVPKNINQDYLYWFCTAYEKDIRENCMKSGTTVESVEAKKLMDYIVRVPSDGEQLEIVKVIEALLDKEEVAKETAEQVIEQIDLMKKSILAKAFRGELGTNNVEEESSIELLKQILD